MAMSQGALYQAAARVFQGLLPRSGSVSSAVLRVFLREHLLFISRYRNDDFLDEQSKRPADWLEPLSGLLNAALANFQ